MSAERQPDHKRLFEPELVDDVADALAADLDANIGGTIYAHVRTIAQRHEFDHTHNRIGVAIRHIGESDEYDIVAEPSNADAQRPTWTITREGSDDRESRAFYNPAGPIATQQAKTPTASKGASSSYLLRDVGISLSFSGSDGCGLLGGESTTDSRYVSMESSGTTEANRIICNCVTCGRVRSIESGRGGECADCWGEAS